MSEDKTQQAIQRGERARALLEDEVLTKAFDDLQKQYADALFLTHPLDEKTREKLYIAFNVCGKVKQHLHTMVADGRIAKLDLDERLAKEKRKKP